MGSKPRDIALVMLVLPFKTAVYGNFQNVVKASMVPDVT